MSGWVEVTKKIIDGDTKKQDATMSRPEDLDEILPLFWARGFIFLRIEKRKIQNSTASCGRKQIKTDQQKRFNKWLKLSINQY